MTSPIRRSARGAPPGKPPPPASTASSSSLSSGRQDRGVSSGTKQKSVTPHSLSSEDVSEPPRRSQRSHPVKRHDGDKDVRGPEAANEEEEEEEVTRCVCGHQEYPGPPQSIAFTEAELQSEDAGGLFISCDGCSVWQHGGCVGIVEDSQAPDKYYCEECRPKLHDLHTDSRGQKYSLYIPLHPKPSRKQSMSKHGDKAQKEREALMPSRLSTDPATGRRRATMRSKEHDDEEEQFLRAIEESKREVEGETSVRRSGKRSRDESEENKHDIKRQRTASESLPSISRMASREDESDPEAGPASARHKKARAEAAQSARQAEVREKEKEREKARAEAAGRRQERAGRRRADEPEEEETPNPNSGEKASPPPSSLPDTPPVEMEAEAEKILPKKGPGRKTKKLGNNQYTRQRDSSHPTASSPHSKKRIPTSNNAASSGDEQTGNGEGGNGVAKNSPALEGNGNGRGKFGKGRGRAAQANGQRHAIPQDISELTIPDMARQITAMAAFMARAQPDLLGDRTPPGSDIGEKLSEIKPRGAGSQLAQSIDMPVEGLQHTSVDGRKFEDLNATEMAGLLSRNMAFWETKFVAPSPSS